MAIDAGPFPSGRRRGRPVGADSVETRARILRSARDVINERGYEAATFQAVASRAGLSRPTMHYYFHTREEVYECLVAETASIVADCIKQAKRENTLLNQLSAFVAAAYRCGFADRSMMRFVVTAHIEFHRNPSMSQNLGPVVSLMQEFYTSLVADAVDQGDIPADTDLSAVVNMLLAMFLGMGFYAGFIADQDHAAVIAKQLRMLMTHGLLEHPRSGPALTVASPVSAAVAG